MTGKPKDTSGPAFPHESYDAEMGMDTVKPGMSLRDWYAGMALQGMFSSYKLNGTCISESECEEAAEDAFRAANAMIKMRGLYQ